MSIIKGSTLRCAFLLLIIFSCHDAPRRDNASGKNPTDSAEVSINGIAADTIYAGTADTTVPLHEGQAFIKGHIAANKNQPRYTVAARKGQIVTAIVKPSKKGGNVRINQIKQPGGAFDGPFGDSLTYTFQRNGNIQFIIGENLMAGDPYTGDFTLHIILSDP